MKWIFITVLLLSGCCYAQDLKTFDNGDIQLFYEGYGKGPALYILTGGPGAPPNDPSHHQIIDSLKPFYTCVLLHQRGSGKSRNIPINEQTINIKSYLRDIELLRQKRNDKKIILLGISWGGLLAMNYAVLHPQYVSKLVLIGSAPPSYKIWNVLFDNQYVRRSVAELDSMNALTKIFSVKTDRELDSLKRVNPSSSEVVAFKNFMAIHVRAMYYDRNKLPRGFDELFTNFNFQPIPFIDKEVMETKWDITADLKKLNIPALIMYGRQDDQGESTFFLQKECLKNSEMHVIEKSGHIVWEDQPREFYKILMNYLTKSRK
ncbi:MAG: alpha/beta fold hydrolase [Chitinophagaceae bacterium]